MPSPRWWREMYVDRAQTIATGCMTYTAGALHQDEPELEREHQERLKAEEDAVEREYTELVRTR